MSEMQKTIDGDYVPVVKYLPDDLIECVDSDQPVRFADAHLCINGDWYADPDECESETRDLIESQFEKYCDDLSEWESEMICESPEDYFCEIDSHYATSQIKDALSELGYSLPDEAIDQIYDQAMDNLEYEVTDEYRSPSFDLVVDTWPWSETEASFTREHFIERLECEFPDADFDRVCEFDLILDSVLKDESSYYDARHGEGTVMVYLSLAIHAGVSNRELEDWALEYEPDVDDLPADLYVCLNDSFEAKNCIEGSVDFILDLKESFPNSTILPTSHFKATTLLRFEDECGQYDVESELRKTIMAAWTRHQLEMKRGHCFLRDHSVTDSVIRIYNQRLARSRDKD